MALGSGYPTGGAKPKPVAPPKKPPKRAPPQRRPPPKRPGRPGPGRPFSPGPRKAPKPPVKPPAKPPGRFAPTRPHWFDPLFEPKKPGLRRMPRQTPMQPFRWNPWRLPSPLTPFFDPWTDIPAFFLPKKEAGMDMPAGWAPLSECPRNPLYNLGPSFGFQRVSCVPTPTPGCATAQGSQGPGAVVGTRTCQTSGSYPTGRCVQFAWGDNREVSPGVYRQHLRGFYLWNCQTNGGQPDTTTNPIQWYRPETPVVIPFGPPDPWAQQPPGRPMPNPKPFPFRDLPYAPDPNAWIPGAPGVVTPPAIDPDPFVWVDPVPNPNPQPNPAPNPVPPLPFPFPVPGDTPNPAPNPGTPPYMVPAPGVSVTIGAAGASRPSPRTLHRRMPRRSNEKERKHRVGGVFGMIWNAFGQITEGLDLLDIAYDAMPCSVKAKAGMFGRRITPADKAAFVAKHFKEMNMNEFARGYAKNQFEDWFYGLTSVEKAYYQSAYRGGLNLHGGKFAGQNRYSLEQDNPLIDAFNEYVDTVFGPPPTGAGSTRC